MSKIITTNELMALELPAVIRVTLAWIRFNSSMRGFEFIDSVGTRKLESVFHRVDAHSFCVTMAKCKIELLDGNDVSDTGKTENVTETAKVEPEPEKPIKRKRGRPRKEKPEAEKIRDDDTKVIPIKEPEPEPDSTEPITDAINDNVDDLLK